MTTARSKLVDPNTPLFYHLVSRCVRRSWLCGSDSLTGKDYTHRKNWLVERVRHLSKAFAVDIYAYAVMSNHFHLCVFYDPLASRRWSDVEVVRRWLLAFPVTTRDGHTDFKLTEQRRKLLLSQPESVARCRKTLGCLSAFMKHLKQPIARRANREDGCQGHFFESRFYSGALLTDEAVIAAMAYVDLNPVRAQIARSLEQCVHASIAERLAGLENSKRRLELALRPLEHDFEPNDKPADVPKTPALLPMSMWQYVNLLQTLIAGEGSGRSVSAATRRWMARVAANRERQRAYGLPESLSKWVAQRGFRNLEKPLPS